VIHVADTSPARLFGGYMNEPIVETALIYCPKCGDNFSMMYTDEFEMEAECPECKSLFQLVGWVLLQDGDEREIL
jgi:C4-type Zn-finger protein